MPRLWEIADIGFGEDDIKRDDALARHVCVVASGYGDDEARIGNRGEIAQMSEEVQHLAHKFTHLGVNLGRQKNGPLKIKLSDDDCVDCLG